jgi:decaprenylphospho-beta-D-erythro-pentofuranosid-2-ulose 2-reductase
VKDALGSVQSVLVLGGASDIARATVKALVADRARAVTLAVRRPEQLDDVGRELKEAGATDVRVLAFDADDLESHPAFVAEAFAGGDVDLVLLAFGVLGDADHTRVDRKAALELLHTNVMGSVSVLMPVVERLKAQGHGTVVVLSSVAGERVRKSNFPYGASKAALDGFASGLADHLHGSGVHVMVVRPGFVATKMTAGMEKKPMSTTPERVAQVIVEGLRKGADTVWAPPSIRWVFAALRHLPRPLFRRLDL